jgi:predicted dehydrogenase
MKAGRHVYAEKPCALCQDDLDKIVQTSKETGMIFREMAGTAFAEPYASMREVVATGVLGEIVQVFSQKSYPYHDGRPQHEDIDGGLLLQAGIHAFRMVEHVTGLRIDKVAAYETKHGNPVPGGGLHMAATIAMTLCNGGTASIIVNYLNQPGHGKWGNEHLRIFGRDGFVESTDGGLHTRLVVGNHDRGPLAIKNDRASYFDMLVDMILDGTPMPLTMEEELRPLRAALRAKRAADA